MAFDWRRGFHRSESRAIDKMALWGQGGDFDDGVHAGVSVTQASALQLVAVYACVRLLADTIAALPADLFRKRAGVREPIEPGPRWLRQPNPETTWFEFIHRVENCLELDGNAFILITSRDALGDATEMWTLHPRQVEVRRQAGRVVFVWNGDQVLSRFGPDNPQGDVLHIKAFADGGLRGLSPIGVAKQAIGLGLVTEKFGSTFFGQGQQLSGVIQIPEGSKPSSDDIDRLREDWKKHHSGSSRAHLPGILTAGATWQRIAVNAEEAQFLETRKFQVAEIARLYGVPPHMIGDVEKSTSWGTGIEQQSIGFVQYSLMARLVRLESAFDQLTPRGQFIKWNVNGLLRGDMAARAAFYASGIQNTWLAPADARGLEDLTPIDGLEEPLVPANMRPLSQAKEAPVPVNGGDVNGAA
jgi:HK97 family phage portal protein